VINLDSPNAVIVAAGTEVGVSDCCHDLPGRGRRFRNARRRSPVDEGPDIDGFSRQRQEPIMPNLR
jgi:hypothetical protein